jgi:hypothetical protein
VLLRNAAYASLSTLAFVAPKAILPSLQDRVVSGLSPSLLSFVGPTELGIYNTPAGVTFVDGKLAQYLASGVQTNLIILDSSQSC